MTQLTTDRHDQLMQDGLKSVKEAGRFLTLCPGMIYKLMRSGELPTVKIGRSCRIPQRALVELAARCMVAGTERS